ncbi:hypothetical protein LguiA_017196 [Lonicera macranthoides]
MKCCRVPISSYDEELVGFYLKRKIQQLSIPIELMEQMDIYKHDCCDLPNLASTGEKEWYFYCPRDHKYKNGAWPNRVTGGWFWKATGTDRPIYSSDGTKCISLKKLLDKNYHANVRPKQKFILKLNVQQGYSRKPIRWNKRALSHLWVTPFIETTASDIFTVQGTESNHLSSQNNSSSAIHLCNNGDLQQDSSASFSCLDISAYAPQSESI